MVARGSNDRGRFRVVGAAALLAWLTACQSLSSLQPTGVARPTREAAVKTPIPSDRWQPIDPTSIQIQLLDARFVPADAPLSADGQVLWTAGATRPSELWRFIPGAEPERIFSSPQADGAITAFTGSSAGYAFVEESPTAYGLGGWRLWLLADSGQKPIELDHGSAPGAGVAPTLAMDTEHIAWAAFDEPAGGPVSMLKVATIADPTSAVTLIDAPIRDRKVWYPALSGQELWYATIEPDPKGLDDEFHVEERDLAQPHGPPSVFRGLGHDFSPAVDAEFIVWKTTDPGDSALNWGTLRVLDRRTGDVRAIPVDKANRPSIGDRFVAFDEITHARLVVYDLATRRIVEIAHAESGAPTYGGTSLQGRLLTFFTQAGEGQPRIGWAILPE